MRVVWIDANEPRSASGRRFPRPTGQDVGLVFGQITVSGKYPFEGALAAFELIVPLPRALPGRSLAVIQPLAHPYPM